MKTREISHKNKTKLILIIQPRKRPQKEIHLWECRGRIYFQGKGRRKKNSFLPKVEPKLEVEQDLLLPKIHKIPWKWLGQVQNRTLEILITNLSGCQKAFQISNKEIREITGGRNLKEETCCLIHPSARTTSALLMWVNFLLPERLHFWTWPPLIFWEVLSNNLKGGLTWTSSTPRYQLRLQLRTNSYRGCRMPFQSSW